MAKLTGDGADNPLQLSHDDLRREVSQQVRCRQLAPRLGLRRNFHPSHSRPSPQVGNSCHTLGGVARQRMLLEERAGEIRERDDLLIKARRAIEELQRSLESTTEELHFARNNRSHDTETRRELVVIWDL